MAKNSSTHRRDLLYKLLQRQPFDITELHERYNDLYGENVSRKTIGRDMDYLSENYNILSTENFPRQYYADANYSPNYELKLNEKQLEAITIALEYLKQTGHDYLAQKCQESLNVMLNHLPPGLAKNLDNNAKKYFFNSGISGKPQSIDPNALEKIMDAIRNKKTIQCKNHSPYKDKKYNQRIRHFAPLLFSMSAGVPYIIVQDEDDKKLKRIRATRLSEVEITDNYIHKELLENIHNDLHNSFGGYGGITEETIKFEIICNKVVKTYFVEREIHPTQKITKLSSGRYKITFEVASSSEIPRFLASFGGDISNVKPASVFNEIRRIWETGLKQVG